MVMVRDDYRPGKMNREKVLGILGAPKGRPGKVCGYPEEKQGSSRRSLHCEGGGKKGRRSVQDGGLWKREGLKEG